MEYSEKRPLRLVELFAGIGSQTQALKNIGVPHRVAAISEIDKYAVKSYEALHGGVNNLGDITKIQSLPPADLWTYSSPCQDISVAGKLGGIKDGTRSGLLYEVERLLRTAAEEGTLPKYLLLENVKNLIGKRFRADFDKWLEFLSSLGYANYWKVLNARDYGIPQNRERVFCISIRGEHKPFAFPEKQELRLRLRDMLDETVDEKYYLKDSTIQAILHSSFKQRQSRINDSNSSSVRTLLARDYKEPQCVQVGELSGEKWEKMNDISRRVYDTEGLSPTVHCQQGGNTELKIAEHFVLGGLQQHQTPRSDGVCPTLTEAMGKGGRQTPLIAAMRGRNPENPSDRTAGSHKQQRLEINECGVSNTLTSVQKDNLIVEQAYVARKYKEFIDQHGYIPEFFNAYNAAEVCDVAKTITSTCAEPSQSGAILKMDSEYAHAIWCGRHGSVDRHAWDVVEISKPVLLTPNNWNHNSGDCVLTREIKEADIYPALQASAGQTQQSSLKVKVATKLGYEEAKEGNYVNITYPGSKTKRGRVGEGVAQTLTCGDGNGVVIENVRIRKLTPRECLRLMGWKDEQIDKIQAAKVSGTQQYRQAGNGIVVQVLEAIFKALFLS